MDKISTHGSMIEQLDLSGVPRSGFDMAFHNYLTGRLGAIIPTAVKEVLPGDRIKGSTHIVTNFEPLASPIMANMVQKEETFFVPYSVIWEKAHRFFTGKKGFKDEMPSMSKKDIYDILYDNSLLCPMDIYLSKEVDPTEQITLIDLTSLNAYVQTLSTFPIIANNGLKDLFKPLISKLNRIIEGIKSVVSSNLGVIYYADLTDAQKDYIITALTDFYYSSINFWFGPSSMLDYMGYGYIDFYDDLHGYMKTFISDTDYNPEQTHTPEYFVTNYFANYLNTNLVWLPLRAAYWVWYWNYRDQLIETDVIDPEEDMFSSTISDGEVIACLLLRQRCWFKDTFTTALTNTGDANLVVPLSRSQFELSVNNANNLDNTADAAGVIETQREISTITIGGIQYQVPSLYLNSSVSPADRTYEQPAISLNLIDRARRLSSWLSKRLVLGTEYDDVVYSSFMVKLSNVRMHVPELLSAGRSDVAINVVVNNTQTDQQIAGSKTAVAFANNINDISNINYFAEEHGLLLSFLTIMPIQSYPAQIQRLLFKRNRFDFAWPEFAQLGMDAIYLSELNGAVALDDTTALTVFGYQGRYYDYKCNQDEEHGRLHTDLNYLTFGRVWSPDELPKLNSEFIHCWPRTDMFVTDDESVDLFRSDVHHRWAMERCLPVPSDVLR